MAMFLSPIAGDAPPLHHTSRERGSHRAPGSEAEFPHEVWVKLL